MVYRAPCSTMFTGMSQAQLLAALAAAQQAYLDLVMGKQGVSFSYTQGDGAKSVTYKPSDPAALAALIVELQQVTGTVRRARRPVGFVYR